ncbi:hypothetical protein Tco_0247110 [Tanacetum coccineum]
MSSSSSTFKSSQPPQSPPPPPSATSQSPEAVIDNNIIHTLVILLGLEGRLVVRKKAVLAVKFVAIGGAREQIRHLLDNGFKSLFEQKFMPAEGWKRMVSLSVHLSSKIQEAVEMFKKTYRCRDVADGGGGGD